MTERRQAPDVLFAGFPVGQTVAHSKFAPHRPIRPKDGYGTPVAPTVVMRRRLRGLGLVAVVGGLLYSVYCSLSTPAAAPAPAQAVAAERLKRPAPARIRTAPTASPARTHTPGVLASHVHSAASRHGVPPLLLAAVIAAESEFNPRAVSHRGAVGLMQLMPMTALVLGVRDAFDPHENVHAGARYLRDLLTRFSNDVPLALAAYNAGPQAVIRHGGVPPYPETRAFVARVMQRMREPRSGGVVMATVAAASPGPSRTITRVRVDTTAAEPSEPFEPPVDVVHVSLKVDDAIVPAPIRTPSADRATAPRPVPAEAPRPMLVSAGSEAP